MRRALPVVVLFALASAAVPAAAAPSEVVFPPQRLPLKFSHKMHLGFKLQCDFCHSRAERSTAASDDLIPSEETCRTCHKIDRSQPEKEDMPEARCDACHEGPDPTKPPRVEVPPPNLRFNHKVHVERGYACVRCHPGVPTEQLATRDDLPRMQLCLGCHNQTAQKDKAPAKCTTCHISDFDGTLRTRFPEGLLVPSGTLKGDAHTPDFERNHADVGKDQRYCESCHRRDFCNSCHNGVVKPLSFHGNDYLSIHPIEARKASLRCDGCHRRQTFCLGCHERAGLTDAATASAPDSLFGARPPRRFHPPPERWVLPPRTPDHHSWQAERNIKQCISCHREETCLQCHSATTMGPGPSGGGQCNHGFCVSPHPAGFGGSRTCESLRAKNGRVCLKCHAPTDPHLSCM
jgi:hypothetical protein